jgi:hypothetical protein
MSLSFSNMRARLASSGFIRYFSFPPAPAMSAAERLATHSDSAADDRLAALRARIARLVPAPAAAPSVLPTGIPGLDRALSAGGLTRGAVTTLVGPAGAGVTTVWRAMVAAVLASGGRVAVIDATRTLAPRDFAGLVPPGAGRRDRLVFVRPPDATSAPWCADLLVRSGAFPLVVLDGAPLLSRAVTGRLAQLAREADTALLVTGDESGATALGGMVRVRVQASGPGGAVAGGAVAGGAVAGGAVAGGAVAGGAVAATPITRRRRPATASEPGAAVLVLQVEKGGASLRPVEVSCVLVAPRRLCAHPEVPDRRGVARRATAAAAGCADPGGSVAGVAPPDRTVPVAPVRRGRRVAEPRLARR